MSVLLRRAFIALVALLAVGALVVAPSPRNASGQGGLASQRDAAARLKSAIAEQERRIDATRDGLAEARRRLAELQERARRRQDQLDATQDRLVRARVRLTRLERKEAKAKHVLSENLIASYKAGRPSVVTVVVTANGFKDLIERVEFLRRVSRSNASILDDTREARAAVQRQTKQLKTLRVRYSTLAKDAIDDRDRAYVVRSALLRREARQLRQRNGVAARLATVRSRINRLEREQAAAARAAEQAADATTQAPRPQPVKGGGGDVVARVVAAANEIATTPYVYGGGHGGNSNGYDCSGSVSYALAAAGLLSSPLDSTGFMSWGESGPGRRITIYANPGHMFMVVDGRRFDTTALSGSGTRWTSASRSTAGFVARHPPGL
jgi:cell wall-associated NlpC family hydrolase